MTELRATVDEQGPALRNIARERRPDRAAVREPAAVRRGVAPGDPLARRGVGRRPRGRRRRRAPTVGELEQVQRAGVPEVGKNLAIILEHLDDRELLGRGGPAQPRRQGLHRPRGAAPVLLRPDAWRQRPRRRRRTSSRPSRTRASARSTPTSRRRRSTRRSASQALGPNQIGINFPDATAPKGYDGDDRGPDAATTPTRSARPSAAATRGRPPTRSSRPTSATAAPRRARPATRRRRPTRRRPSREARAAGRAAEARRHPARRRRRRRSRPRSPEVPPSVPDVTKSLPLSANERRSGDEQLLDFLFGS